MSPSTHQYDTYAAGYAARLDPNLAGAVDRVVELSGARPGLRLLDLATGTGTIARAAAAKGASVVGVDASTGMLDVARSLSPELDLRLAEVYALPFADGVFDVVTCGLALSHFADRGRALAEVLRVVRPDGVLVASAWAGGCLFPTAGASELLAGYAEPVASEVDEDTWADPESGCEVLRAAGFADVSIRTESFHGEFAGIDDALAWFAAWPLTATRLARLEPDAREQFFSEARDVLATNSLAWTFAFNFYLASRP